MYRDAPGQDDRGRSGLDRRRLSPFYRQTFWNWDQFRQVDAQGMSVTTWLNAALVSAYGVGVGASLQQSGKFGGTLSGNAYRERRDANNLTFRSATDASIWSLSLIATYQVIKPFDLQALARYNPAQTQARGLAPELWVVGGAPAGQTAGDQAAQTRAGVRTAQHERPTVTLGGQVGAFVRRRARPSAGRDICMSVACKGEPRVVRPGLVGRMSEGQPPTTGRRATPDRSPTCPDS